MSSSSSARGFPVELRGLEWAIHQALQAELLLKQQQSWTASRRRLLRLQASSNSNCDDDDKDNPIDVFPANEQQLLHQCVEPVLRQMQAIDAEALLGLTRTTEPGRGARLRDGIRVLPIHNDIVPRNRLHPDYTSGSTNNNNINVVRYLHIYDVPEQYSIGIFVFAPRSKIPLHDHPGMCVLSRLLYGDIARISLDLAPLSGSSATKDPLPYTTTTTTNSARNSPSGSTASSLWNWVYSWLPPWKGKSDPTSDPLFSDGSSSSNTNTYPLESEDETKQAAAGSSSRRLAFYQSKTRRNGNDDEDWLSAPDCTVLFPFEGNVHEFSAGPEGAAILDVLIPPYDVDRDRDCTYYEIKDYFHYATAGLAAGTDTHPVSNSSRSSSSSTLHSVEKFTTSSTITTDHDRRNGTTLAAACDPSSSAAVHHFGGDPCWIVPMEQPDDFHCVSGTYNGLGEE